MPTVFTKDGFRFFFYSNDHTPIHVHVRRGDGEAVFIVGRDVVLRESIGLKTSELARAEELAIEHKELILRSWLNTLVDTPASATYSKGMITILMESGLEISFPCEAYPRLANASENQRSNFELSPMGLHWPDLDEDLSIRGLLRAHGKREQAAPSNGV